MVVVVLCFWCEGGVVIGVEWGFVFEGVDGLLKMFFEVWSDVGICMNDGGCDLDGCFYCGFMAYDQRLGAASLYCLDPDGSVHIVITGCTISNGLEWSLDGMRAYYNDTDTGQVDVFDYACDTGLTARRTFVTIVK